MACLISLLHWLMASITAGRSHRGQWSRLENDERWIKKYKWYLVKLCTSVMRGHFVLSRIYDKKEARPIMIPLLTTSILVFYVYSAWQLKERNICMWWYDNILYKLCLTWNSIGSWAIYTWTTLICRRWISNESCQVTSIEISIWTWRLRCADKIILPWIVSTRRSVNPVKDH